MWKQQDFQYALHISSWTVEQAGMPVTWSFLLDAMPKKDNSEDLDHLCADFTPA
jgi:hypothetical protein